MAGTITIRINDNEEEVLNRVAAIYGMGKSSLLKRLAFEKLEDEYDIQVFEAYEAKKAAGEISTRPIEELWKELEL